MVSDEYDTLAGWLLEQFDDLPETGDHIKRDNVLYKIEKREKRQIKSVRISFP